MDTCGPSSAAGWPTNYVGLTGWLLFLLTFLSSLVLWSLSEPPPPPSASQESDRSRQENNRMARFANPATGDQPEERSNKALIEFAKSVREAPLATSEGNHLEERSNKALIEFAKSVREAPLATSEAQGLAGIKSFQPFIELNDAVKQAVNEDQFKTKFELKLRQLGIKLDKQSPYFLGLRFYGMWDEKKIRMAYHTRIEVMEFATVFRGDTVQRVPAVIWSRAFFGYAGNYVAEKVVLSTIEQQTELFANAYLTANPK